MKWRRLLGRAAGPVGLTAAWGVRKGLSAAYRKRTGRMPPRGLADGTPMRHALLWSVVSAAALALVEVLVQRIFRGADDVKTDDVPTKRSDSGTNPPTA